MPRSLGRPLDELASIGPRQAPEGSLDARREYGSRTEVVRKSFCCGRFRPPRYGLLVMKKSRRQEVRLRVQRTLGHVDANTEGGRKVDGRWNPPTNFGPLVGDLLDMRNSAPVPRSQLPAAIGGRLWPPPHEGTLALEEMGS